MKNTIQFLIILCFVSLQETFAQCNLGSITLSSQTEVDNFVITYGNCSSINAEIIISGPDISNLTGINQIKSIDGELDINNNPMLLNLDDLLGLQAIDGVFRIRNNSSLTSISGLSNYTMSYRFYIENNNQLGSLQGLQNIPSSDAVLCFIRNNDNLMSLNGLVLPAISQVFLYVSNNNSLNNISALNGIREISLLGLFGTQLDDLDELNNLEQANTLVLFSNDFLSDITGLNNVSVIRDLEIRFCPLLSSLSGLENITKLNNVAIEGMDQLSDISALNGVNHLTGMFDLSQNPVLQNTANFQPLHGIGDDVRIYNNPLLEDLSFLSNIDSINGVFEVQFNNSITDIDGLSQLLFVDGDFEMSNNNNLTDCSGLCNFLKNGIHNGGLSISGNPSACSSKAEISAACSPSNDFCHTAMALTLDDCIVSNNFYATASDNPYPGILCGSNYTDTDVWYSVIVSPSGDLYVDVYSYMNGSDNLNIELYEGADCNSLNPLVCSSKYFATGSSFITAATLEGRTPGEVIYIRIMENYFSEGEFELCVSDAGYEDSCKIEKIELGNQTTCDPSSNSFTQELLVTYRNDGSATHIRLNNLDYFALTSSPQLINLELPANGYGLDLHARLVENFTFGACSDASIYSLRDAFQAPVPCYNGTVLNDDCIDAIPLAVSKGCIDNIFDNTGSTHSVAAGITCFAGDESQDIWFEVTVPQSGELIINTYVTDIQYPAYAIYEGDCNNLQVLLSCAVDNSYRLTGRQPGEIIYIRAYTADNREQGEFGICAIEPEAHTNDTCTDAIDIPVSSDCTSEVYSTHFASAENGSINCNGNSNNSNDIWFNIVMPNSGNLLLKTEEVERGTSNIIMEVYSGNCQSQFTICASGNSLNGHAEINMSGISPGSQLRVRIASNSPFVPATFLLCATSECPNHDVIGTISQGTRDFEADISIVGYETLSSGTDVTFDAGMMVNLDPGFEVESSAIFHAFIDGCGGQ